MLKKLIENTTYAGEVQNASSQLNVWSTIDWWIYTELLHQQQVECAYTAQCLCVATMAPLYGFTSTGDVSTKRTKLVAVGSRASRVSY